MLKNPHNGAIQIPLFRKTYFDPQNSLQNSFQTSKIVFNAPKSFFNLQNRFQRSKIIFKAPKSFSKLQKHFQTFKTIFNAQNQFQSSEIIFKATKAFSNVQNDFQRSKSISKLKISSTRRDFLIAKNFSVIYNHFAEVTA